jgi:hypothetical protein
MEAHARDSFAAQDHPRETVRVAAELRLGGPGFVILGLAGIAIAIVAAERPKDAVLEPIAGALAALLLAGLVVRRARRQMVAASAGSAPAAPAPAHATVLRGAALMLMLALALVLAIAAFEGDVGLYAGAYVIAGVLLWRHARWLTAWERTIGWTVVRDRGLLRRSSRYYKVKSP